MPQLSPDKQYIAMFRSLADDWLEIYSRSGDLVSSTKVSENNFAWLSDGRIVYVNGRRFIFTYPNSTEAEYNLELPGGLAPDAFIGIFAVSPNEEKIVFNLVTSEYSKPYIVDINGNNIRQLADVPSDYSYKVINEPQWSPDGKWILLKQGVSAVSGGTQGTRPYLFIVPSDLDEKVLILSAIENQRSPEVREFIRYESFDNKGSVTNRALSSTALFWIP
jgi:Tol biopolymer transport system component